MSSALTVLEYALSLGPSNAGIHILRMRTVAYQIVLLKIYKDSTKVLSDNKIVECVKY